MTTTIPQIRGEGHTRSAPPFRLRGRVHGAVLCAHILTSVGWFGPSAWRRPVATRPPALLDGDTTAP